jgi:hypothetical protein
MRHLISSVLVGLFVSASACGGEHGDATAPPSAPTGLTVSAVSGGAHLTWTDTSDNEEHFMIMRKPTGGAYDDVDTVAFNTVTYHDSSVTAGMTYVYKVVAMNAKGEASSNEVTFAP